MQGFGDTGQTTQQARGSMGLPESTNLEVGNVPVEVQKNAIANFLTQCEKELRERNRERAVQFLARAARRIQALPDMASRNEFQEQYHNLERNVHLIQLFPRAAKPFERRTKIYTKETMDPIAYSCFHKISRYMRTNVFIKELNIPVQIEFDERDDVALHGIVLIGDAPQTYARFWIDSGESNVKWAVLDRMCTLRSVHVSRQKGHAVYMLNSLVYYLDSIAAKANLHVLVVHVPIKSSLPIVDTLLAKGFRFVLSHEAYQQRKSSSSASLFYFEGDRMRLNTVHLYFPLPNIPEERVRMDLEEIRKAEQRQIAISQDPENIKRQREVFMRARKRYEEYKRQQELAQHQDQDGDTTSGNDDKEVMDQ
mmetsp:Transcript_10252/g.20084  ORF Transcript_10252/g.20084 Transcript_10252/m.20084 type:complete len:367 (-) Transcript_10252:647-1747(-)